MTGRPTNVPIIAAPCGVLSLLSLFSGALFGRNKRRQLTVQATTDEKLGCWTLHSHPVQRARFQAQRLLTSTANRYFDRHDPISVCGVRGLGATGFTLSQNTGLRNGDARKGMLEFFSSLCNFVID